MEPGREVRRWALLVVWPAEAGARSSGVFLDVAWKKLREFGVPSVSQRECQTVTSTHSVRQNVVN